MLLTAAVLTENNFMESTSCRIIWAAGITYTPNIVVSLHEHTYYHYLYVRSGSGTIRIGNEILELKVGCIYLMPPYTQHEIRSDSNGFVSCEVKFEAGTRGILSRIPSLPNSLNIRSYGAEPVFDGMFDEFERSAGESDSYSAILLSLRLSELLCLLLRADEQLRNTASESSVYTGRYAKVLTYIDDHLSEDISLEMLAAIVHSEKSYFLKKFKHETGMTPMNYLRRIRIDKAKKLLLHSDMNITQISAAVGFQSIHHFSSVFKQTVGVSPSEFKDMHR